MKALTRTLAALLLDALFVAVILVTLAGLQYLLALLPLSPPLRAYLVTLHEGTTLVIFAIFVLKAVLRLLVSTSEQVDELAQSLKHDPGKKADGRESNSVT